MIEDNIELCEQNSKDSFRHQQIYYTSKVEEVLTKFVGKYKISDEKVKRYFDIKLKTQRKKN